MIRLRGDSFAETSGGSSKDAEDNSFTEILGSLLGDSVNISSVFLRWYINKE